MKYFLLSLIFMGTVNYHVTGQKIPDSDTVKTSGGNLIMTFLGHGSLLFTFQEKYLYIDPVMQVADVEMLPKADAILITHDHGDHLDPVAVEKLRKSDTQVFLTKICQSKISSGTAAINGYSFLAAGVPVEAVPAYNITGLRGNGKPYHQKGEGNGYVLDFDDIRVYVAGDTELTPEMAKLKGIDIAFLPIGMPYTMEPRMAAEAARVLNVQILYPYHFNNSNPDDVFRALIGSPVEVRIRSLK